MFLLATTEVMLALLLAASTAFRDGVAALRAEKYEVAIAQLSLVYEIEAPENVLRGEALYFRGVAQLAAGDRDAAVDDWLRLKQSRWGLPTYGASGHMMRQRAHDAMKAAGVSEHEMMEPEWAVRTLLNTLKKDKWDEALPYMSPELAAAWKAEKGPPDFALMQALNPGGGPGSLVRMTAADKAAGQFVSDAGSYQVELERRERLWVVTKLTAFHHDSEPHHSIQQNLANIRALGATIRAYVEEHKGVWPASLKALAEAGTELPPESLVWHTPRSEQKATMLYLPPKPGQAAPQPTDPILAAPEAFVRHYLVYRADGEAVAMPERDFKAWRAAYEKPVSEQAEDARVKAEREVADAAAKKAAAAGNTDLASTHDTAQAEAKLAAKLADDRAAQVAVHMQAIATGDVVTRVAARKALRAMGADAIPGLQRYLKSEDPEVRETARELIRAATPAEAEAEKKPADNNQQRQNGQPWIF